MAIEKEQKYWDCLGGGGGKYSSGFLGADTCETLMLIYAVY